MSKITKEVFDIPERYLNKAFKVEDCDDSNMMLLISASDSVINFRTCYGEIFKCTFQEYKNGYIRIYPMEVCKHYL